MSKCDLTIVLDKADRTYARGEEIRGTLRVEVNAPCRCDALTIMLRWRTGGRGDEDAGRPVERTLFKGEWAPGKRLDYPFAFPCPGEPPTYRGKLVSVAWHLSAQADIPWAIDPKAEREVVVLAAPQGTRDAREGAPARPALPATPGGRDSAPASASLVGCMVAAVAPFLLAGVCLATSGVLGLLGFESPILQRHPQPMETAVSLFFGVAFTAIPLHLLIRSLGPGLAARRLGAVRWSIAPGEANRGDAVRCTLSFRPVAGVRIRHIEFSLRGEEGATRRRSGGSGRGSGPGPSRTATREFRATSVALSGPRTVAAGESVEVEGLLVIPPDAVPGFDFTYNSLRWRVRARVALHRWPDWTDDAPIVIAS